jgi:hypothetical protein
LSALLDVAPPTPQKKEPSRKPRRPLPAQKRTWGISINYLVLRARTIVYKSAAAVALAVIFRCRALARLNRAQKGCYVAIAWRVCDPLSEVPGSVAVIGHRDPVVGIMVHHKGYDQTGAPRTSEDGSPSGIGTTARFDPEKY